MFLLVTCYLYLDYYFFTKLVRKNNNNNNKTYDGMKTGKKTREIKTGKTQCRSRRYRETCKNAKISYAREKKNTHKVCV